MTNKYLCLYENESFVGKFLSLKQLISMTDFSHKLQNKLKKEFTKLTTQTFEDKENKIKIVTLNS